MLNSEEVVSDFFIFAKLNIGFHYGFHFPVWVICYEWSDLYIQSVLVLLLLLVVCLCVINSMFDKQCVLSD